MSARHDPSHAQTLGAILCGDLREEAGAARALLDSCSDCREELARLRAVMQTLDAAAAEEEATLAEALRAPGPALRPAAAVATTRDRDPRTLWRWAAPIAAAALLMFVFVVYSVLTHRSKRVELLGPYGLECLAPLGEVHEYTAFEARGAKPADGWFRFEVFDADAPAGTEPVIERRKIIETKWIPTTTELAKLPDHIVWWVHACGASGEDLDRSHAEVRRSR